MDFSSLNFTKNELVDYLSSLIFLYETSANEYKSRGSILCYEFTCECLDKLRTILKIVSEA